MAVQPNAQAPQTIHSSFVAGLTLATQTMTKVLDFDCIWGVDLLR
jgi:hypothetical protein